MNRHIFRRAAAIVLILTMVFSTGAVYGTDSAAAKALNNPEIPEISARSGVVIDGDTGKILYSKCRNIKRDPYSITKLLTVLVALEHLDPNQKITVNKTAANTEGSTAYLIAGEKVRTKDLVYAALLPSGNDAAVALAYGVSGSKAKFATLMNKKAKKLGCQNSHFANPHGWKSEKHYTTAYDMALITKAAMENDLIRKAAGTEMYKMPKTNKHSARWIATTNYFVAGKKYPKCGVFAGKTGTWDNKNATLVSACRRDGKVLYAVVMKDNYNDREKSTNRILNYSYKRLAYLNQDKVNQNKEVI